MLKQDLSFLQDQYLLVYNIYIPNIYDAKRYRARIRHH